MVYVDREVYVPIGDLAAAPSEPAAPPFKCRDADGYATVCHRDLVSYTERLRGWGRGLRERLDEIRDLQPEDPSP